MQMIGFLKQFITKAVNVHPAEIFDVTICWLVSFFVRAAFVIAWTVLVVEFIQYFGISSIAFLFLAHGLTSILGYLLYRVPINRYKPISLLIFSVFATVTFALLAFFSFDVNSYVYITSLLFIVSLFLSQIKIAKLLFVESLFTPTQSTRVFPVIESADTVALIFAGFIVSLVSAYLPLNSLLLVLSFFVLFILPVLSYFTSSSIKHPLTLLINKTHNNTSDTIALSHLFSSKLLLAISAIVFFQFAYFGLLEVQYLFQVFSFSDSVSGNASNLAFDLGMLHIFFGFFTFLFQALLASRILMFSGVIKSMLVCPLVLISSTFLMLFSPGLALVLINKFNFEISNVLHTNAYHGVFYIFSHSSRAKILEFLEGFIRPLALVVTSVFLLLSFNFVNFTLLNILSILILIGSIYSISKFDNSYNFVPRMHLKTSDDPKVILNALSILQQNRSSSNADYLLSIINAKGFTEPIVLKKSF